jgi:hypothetical protein
LCQSPISICACDGLEGDSSVLGYPVNIKELKEIKKESNSLFYQCLNILNPDGCHLLWCSDSKRIYIEKIRYKNI